MARQRWLTLKVIITIALLLGVGEKAVAQSGLKASLTHYDTTDGLPSNALSCLAQDDYGYLWIGTWNGLSRFDGYEFCNYPTGGASGLPLMHNRIIDLAIDGCQNVWMRMYDYRVFVLNRKTDRIEDPFEAIEGHESMRFESKILSTSDGTIWLIQSGDNGLYCCRPNEDGFELTHVETPGLVGRDIVEGFKGEIWMGTNRGLYRIDRQKMAVDKKGYAEGQSITDTYSNGFNVYIGTREGRIYELENGAHFSRVTDVGERIFTLFRDSHGLIWYSTSADGVFRYQPDNDDTKHFTQVVKSPSYDTEDSHLQEVAGVLWIRLKHGGFGYYNRQEDKIEYFHNRPDNTWDLSNTVNCFRVMQEGVIWESTSDRGLEKLELQNSVVERHPILEGADESENEVRAIYYDADRDLMLIGNKRSTLIIEAGGGGKIGKGRRTIIHDDGQGHRFGRIYGITRDSEGDYWICCKSTGVFKMTPEAGGFKFKYIGQDDGGLNSKECYQSVEDLSGNIWVATYGKGINIIREAEDGRMEVLNPSNRLASYPESDYKNIRTLSRDKDGNIWAGTTDGILKMTFDGAELHVERVTENTDPRHMLQSKDIVCLNIAPDGKVWVGTNGGGIAYLMGKNEEGMYEFETFRNSHDLAFGEIKSITFDSRGNVWFSNDNIIGNYDTRKNVFSTLNFQDGLDGTVCSEGAALTLPGDNVIFGTLSGYYILDINKLFTSSGETLKVRLTSFYLNDQLMSPRLDDTYDYMVADSGVVRLPSNSSVVMIKFASLNFQTQHRVHYIYKLEGHDDEWQSATRSRSASYSGMAGGTYQFRVRAFLTEVPDKYDECTLTIIVPPPFWLSWPAIIIYIIILVGGACGILYYRRLRENRLRSMRVLKIGPQEIAFKEEDDYLFVENQLKWLEEHYAEPDMKIYGMVQNAMMSRTTFYNKLKELTGMSPKEFVTDFRVKKAKMYLESTSTPVSEVAFKTGFNDPVYFARVFKQQTGTTPSKYRAMHGKTDPQDPQSLTAPQ